MNNDNNREGCPAGKENHYEYVNYHGYCSHCKTSKKEEWIETLNETFRLYSAHPVGNKYVIEKIIELIRTLLAKKYERSWAEGTDKAYFQGREDGRLEAVFSYKKSLRKQIEGKMYSQEEVAHKGSEFTTPRDSRKQGHNNALQEVLELLREK